jgi:hypothetical protein
MKKFDLEAAKQGAAVCTREGMKARIVCFDRVDLEYPILGLRKNKAGVEYIFSYTLDGFAFLEDIGGDEDLMMRDDDYLEKLERGEYGDRIEDKRKMVAPAIKQNLNTDREYWRRVYAGHIAGGLASHNGLNIIGSEIIVAKASCSMADALIEELEKDEKVL